MANCQLTAFCASVFANVGTVTTMGLEGLLAWQLVPNLSWNSSASYNSSKIKDDYSTGTSSGAKVIASQGKDAVDAPRLMVNSGLFDTSFIGPIGTGGFTVSGDNQTLQAGARRLVFISLGSTF